MRQFVLGLTLAWAAHAGIPALMPLPVKVEPASGMLAIDDKFTAAATGPANARLEAGLTRFISRISRQTGVMIAAAKPVTAHAAAATLRVECEGRGAAGPILGEEESYTLDVTPEGASI